MKKYVFLIFLSVLLLAYFAGGRVATQKCNARIADMNAYNQSIILKKVREVNEKTFAIGVYDIRRILREQYTIKE